MASTGPRLLRTPAEVRRATERWRAAGMRLGLVPTMGALHEGHRALLRRARTECDRVVASVFVNPAQFNDPADLAAYPRSLETDRAVLAAEGVDAVYAPAEADVYPPGFATRVSLTGPLTSRWEAEHRPGHFDGVALVVAKLLVAVRPDRAYFGQKDAQQCAVVRRLAADLDTGVDIVVCPTVRDADGLALSSRNARLSIEERAQALALPRGLAAAARAWQAGERRATALLAAVRAQLALVPALREDYVAAVDPLTFEPVDVVAEGARIVVAVTLGSTRLIDTLSPGVDEVPVVPSLHRDGRGERLERGSRPCTAP